MKKIRFDSWRKLDNTAKIFSLDDKRNTSIFRMSALLTEEIDKNILKTAVIKSLEEYPSYKVKIGSGLFWNYLEYNDKDFLIEEENQTPCEHFDFEKNNDYLFKVTYFKNKINLEIFHVLTDGTGGANFFKILLYNYLETKYKIKSKRKKEKIGYDDYTLKYYDSSYKLATDFKASYEIPGKINKYKNLTYHYTVSVEEIKKVCKKYGVTITEYLTAIYIYALYFTLYERESNKEISVIIPINLRPYFNVDTSSNFFTYFNVVSNFTKKDDITFEDVIKCVHEEFKNKLTPEHVKEYLARDVRLGMNVPLRLVPLVVKKAFIKFMGTLVTKSSTTILSNIGIIDIEKEYQKYIDNIYMLVMPNRVQKIKCSICSYKDNLNITMNSLVNDREFEELFYYLLYRNLEKVECINNRKSFMKRK